MAQPIYITQTPAQVGRISNFFVEGNSILLPCSTTSGSTTVQFPVLRDQSPSTDVLISNRGLVDAWIAFGNATITVAIPTAGVPANGICIPAGIDMALCKGSADYVVGITASSTVNLYISQGYGG